MFSRLSLAAVTAALIACFMADSATAAGANSEPAPGAPSTAAEGSGPALRERVQRLIGRAACDSDAQCCTLPLGVRACGGPEAYVAWSLQGTDAPALRRAAERYGQWQSLQQERGGAMSICMMETDPGAVCASAIEPGKAGKPGSGRCVLREAGSGAVAR